MQILRVRLVLLSRSSVDASLPARTLGTSAACVERKDAAARKTGTAAHRKKIVSAQRNFPGCCPAVAADSRQLGYWARTPQRLDVIVRPKFNGVKG